GGCGGLLPQSPFAVSFLTRQSRWTYFAPRFFMCSIMPAATRGPGYAGHRSYSMLGLADEDDLCLENILKPRLPQSTPFNGPIFSSSFLNQVTGSKDSSTSSSMGIPTFT